ncbi:MAG: hypothetical protein P4N59_32630 [Negativicutes bacterium]|nr:hypothetical protein [Negativicutes bacterium]
MPGSLGQLLGKIVAGSSQIGTYYRRAVEDKTSIRFDKLIVKTAMGGEYLTKDPSESKAFFEHTDIKGTGTNSGYCHEEKCYYYESMGYWRTSLRTPSDP